MKAELSQSQLWFKRGVKFTLVLVIVLLVYFAWPEPVLEIRTVPVDRGVVEELVSSLQAGIVKSRRQVEIRAVAVGRVEVIHVERGIRAKEGQLLVELENGVLKPRVRLARANLAAGQSSYRSAILRRDVAKRTLDRSNKLLSKGALSPQALERVQVEYDVACEAVSANEANLSQLSASVDLALASLEETRIRAPFDGLITQVYIERGESLVIGVPVLDLADDSAITVEATVDEADAGRLKVGMPVKVECDAFPNQPFPGSLSWIAPVIDKDLRQNRHQEVGVSFGDTGSKLKIGMSVDIEIVVGYHTDVLYIPTNAIMRHSEVNQIYVLENSQVQLRTIQTGLANWERTEVVQGLLQGENVVVSLETKGLKDGARARAREAGSTGQVAY